MPLICLILCLFTIASKAQDSSVEGKPKIAYWKIGNKEDIVIVLHGGPGVPHDYLRPEWDRLSEFATLIYYDQRGNGKSEKAHCYSWREHVGDLYRLIKKLSPNQQVILAGSSWGTELAILFAHTHPELIKGVILTGTVPWQGRGNKEKDCSTYTYHQPEESDIAKLNQSLGTIQMDTSQFSKRPPLLAIKESEKLKNKSIQSSTKIQFETINSLSDAPRFDQIRISVPILIMQGMELCQFQDVSKQYASISPHSEIIYIEESCHDPWLVKPEKFFSACGKFIEKL